MDRDEQAAGDRGPAIMGKLVEATHVTLGGEVGTNDWALPYLDDQHSQYAMELLTRADALLLGRHTYEGLSVAYTRMADEAPAGVPSDFIARMNRIPKFIAGTTLRGPTWNLVDIRRFDSGVVILVYAPK
jgi:hypothetical protein